MPNSFSFLKDLNISEEAENNLALQLQRTVEGSDEIILTPLGKDHDHDKLLSDVDTIVLNDSTLDSKLIDIEESQRSKFGPRSIAVPWEERRESVSVYFGLGDEYSLASVEPTTSSRLRPLSLQHASDYLKNSTNSGLPFVVKKSKVKEEVLKNFNELLSRKDPCAMFTRTQEQKKTRTVWGFPIADTLNEMRFYRPLLEYQRKSGWRAAIVNTDEVDRTMTHLLHYAQEQKKTLVSIDFSSYDTTLKKSMQDASFHYIKSLFQNQFNDEIDYIAERFRTIGLITPEGVWSGDHGVPTGSTFTNEVDSIAQYVCVQSMPELDLKYYQIQGDDAAYATNDPDKLKESFTRYGLNVNEDKSDISDEYVMYLQNYHSLKHMKDGVAGGIYPIYRALNRLVFQERFDDFSAYDIEGSDFYAIRTISILENCKHHPLFVPFVKYIYGKDKYKLRVTDKGLRNYVKMMTEKVGIEGIFAHQYGDDVRGIRSFDTWKIISEL